jgi:hypothetical protein
MKNKQGIIQIIMKKDSGSAVADGTEVKIENLNKHELIMGMILLIEQVILFMNDCEVKKVETTNLVAGAFETAIKHQVIGDTLKEMFSKAKGKKDDDTKETK